MARMGKKASSKKYRVAGKRGAKGELPDMDEMQSGMHDLATLAAKQKKRGFKKRRKARKE